MLLLFVIGLCFLAQLEDLYHLCLKVELLVVHFVILCLLDQSLVTIAICIPHKTMSLEDQLNQDILQINVAELRREL